MSEEITVEVPLDVDGEVYIFRGTPADVDERLDLWLATQEPTWNEKRPMTGADWAEVESYVMPETQVDPRDTEAYQRALLTQLDYDSTSTGRDALTAQIAETTDPNDSKALHARLIAGEAATMFRREMLAAMPPTPERGTEAYTHWHRPLAGVREDLAQHLALATAEARAFTRPGPHTVTTLIELVHRAQALAEHFGQAWWGPVDEKGLAAWARCETRPVEGRDIALLWALGAEATWDGSLITAAGALESAWRYGYRTTRPDDHGAVVVTAVADLAVWEKARRKA